MAMKTYLVLTKNEFYPSRNIVEAPNLTRAKLEAFKWICDICGDRLCDVDIYEVKGTLDLRGELNPHPHSAMYYCADLDYNTGKKRTREKKRQVKEELKKHEIAHLQRLLDEEDAMAVPYAKMLYGQKIISHDEYKSIKQKFNR